MITLIAACDEAGGIGNKGALPWPRIKQDMNHFRNHTMGRTVIMGRKTFESFGGNPLPSRMNIVVSSTYGKEAEVPRCINSHSTTSVGLTNNLQRALSIAIEFGYSEYDTYVIGGAVMYDHALPFAEKIILTRIVGVFEADTFWKPDLSDFYMTESEKITEDDKVIATIETYRRFKATLPGMPSNDHLLPREIDLLESIADNNRTLSDVRTAIRAAISICTTGKRS